MEGLKMQGFQPRLAVNQQQPAAALKLGDLRSTAPRKDHPLVQMGWHECDTVNVITTYV